jgi:putative addiction module component (TIGR02574 family)
MTKAAEKVTQIALGLPPKARAEVAETLLKSLDSPRQRKLDALWAEEAERRLDAFHRGELKAIPGEEVFRRIRGPKKP